MSYKDGIPLLSTVDDSDPEDFLVDLHSEKPCFKCKRNHVCLGGVVLLVVSLIILAVSVAVVVTLKGKTATLAYPSNSGHDTGSATNHEDGFVSPTVSIELTGSMDIPSTMSAIVKMTSPIPVPTRTEMLPESSAVMASGSVFPSMQLQSTSTGIVAMSIPTPVPTRTHLPPGSSTAMMSDSVLFSTSSPLPTSSPTPIPPGSCADDTSMCPSQRDSRKYQFVNLDSNNLRVVLISDPDTDLSGASMNVAAGSFNDPANSTGMAHFCEHMLFLGTKEYPDKNEYSNFLSTHGGRDNAYTSTQETNYHFRIQANFLKEALDIFSHFFIDPLFEQTYTEKELNAVNQEHQKNLFSDPWKLWQLLKYVSNPHHPFSQFATGSIDTLNQSDIREQLVQFYNESYSASTVS